MEDKLISELDYVSSSGYTLNDLLVLVNYDVAEGTTKNTKITDLNIKPNQVRTVILGDIKTINPRTGKEYTRSQTKSISIYLKNDYNINFSSSNLPKYTLVQSANISGLNPISTKPGMLWTKAGYYVFNFE